MATVYCVDGPRQPVQKTTYEKALEDLTLPGEVVHDTETTGLLWAKDDSVCGVGLLRGTRAFYFPFRHEPGGNLPLSLLRQLAEQVLPPERVQGGFNLKFDLHMMMKEGMQLPNKFWDSQLSAHLLNENEPSFKMEKLAAKYLDPDAALEEEALLDELQAQFGGARDKAKSNLWRLPPEKVAGYACQDLYTTRDLRDFHAEPLKTWGVEELYAEICDYVRVLTKIEENGIPLNIPLIHQYIEESEQHTQECLRLAAESAGYPINLNSSKQCQAWLEMPSTAKDVLGPLLERGDERAKYLLDFRVWSKATANYYRPFLKYCGANGVLHANMNPTGTVIRLSCREPPLQAIPRGTNVYKVKDVFTCEEDEELLEVDISQAEIRVMAHYTKDPQLIDIILSGVNMHDRVAQEQNLPRDVAKRLNFSAQYGIGAPKFSKTYGYPIKDSREYLKKYDRMFPGMKRLYNAAERKASRLGYIKLYTGRYQHFDGKKSPGHKASSRLIQGAVAEMMRIASQRIDRELPEVKQCLQVHDSFILRIPKGKGNELVPEVERIMCDQPWCDIPIKIDAKIGPSWGGAKEFSL